VVLSLQMILPMGVSTPLAYGLVARFPQRETYRTTGASGATSAFGRSELVDRANQRVLSGAYENRSRPIDGPR